MEALGRIIAVVAALLGGICISFFSKKMTLTWQKRQMVRHITYEFAENIISDEKLSLTESEEFELQLRNLGEYETEIILFERKRYEDEEGRKYLYEERKITKEEELQEGSYFRIMVTERNKGVLSTFFYGPGVTLVTGGRIS